MAAPKRHSEIGEELKRASTWVSGPRREKLLAWGLELTGTPADDVEEKVAETIQAQDTPTVVDDSDRKAKEEAKATAAAKADQVRKNV